MKIILSLKVGDDLRIGFGYDVHKLVKNRDLILGGVKIPHDLGLLGHSDADVLVHSIMDSILGALALGDIGEHFPDTDEEYKDIKSVLLLERVYRIMQEFSYEIGNIDVTIAAQEPKLAPYIGEMRKNMAQILDTDIKNINIKATTTEELGFEGRQEGVSSYSVCLLKQV